MTAVKPRLFRLPAPLRLLVAVLAACWAIVAAFPFVWTAVMSFRQPVDALSADPVVVLLGPGTRAIDGGLSAIDLLLGAAGLAASVAGAGRWGPHVAARLGRMAACTLFGAGLAIAWWLLVVVASWLDTFLPALSAPLVGMTLEHYWAVWVTHGFTRNFANSMVVTTGVVVVSLTLGTLAGYALARTRTALAFWILVVALVFRALPQSVLVAGYVPAFLASPRLLAPLWDWPGTGWFLHLFADRPPTLYGQPVAIIAVLVAVNQPFTVWMLRSFFESIPAELDEAALVDGCTPFGAFRRIIMPVMWPGVVTAGLFSFLLAYNDYLVSALLLDSQSMTAVPAITQFLNRDTRASDQMEAIAAAVSITAPLFLLVLAFQRQIVSGLTQGAVKG